MIYTSYVNTKLSETTRETTQKVLFPQESFLIQGACFEIYKIFRNTQKEIVYQKSLALALKLKGLSVEREKQLPTFFLNEKVGTYTPDLLINGIIIVELKAKPFLHANDMRQFWYYLKNSEFRLGYLINFGEPNRVKIIRRVYDTARNNA